MKTVSRRTLFAALGGALAAATCGQPAAAQSPAEFYKDKTVSITVGTGEGGNIALYARTFAEHFSRHLAGNPNVIVQHMPGGGGRRLAAWMQKVAKKDGTVLGITIQTVPFAQRIQPKLAQYDAKSWHWIGNIAPLNSVVAVVSSAPATTLDGARNKEVIMGATGKSSGTYIDVALVNHYAGTKFKIVPGYKGLAALRKATENGELHGFSVNYLSWKTSRADWIKSGKVRFLVQLGLEKDPDLPDVPLIEDLVSDPAIKDKLRFASTGTALARAFFTPPGVPSDRIAALRTAFDTTMKDPKFLADAKKRGMVIQPTNGEKTQALIAKMIDAPQSIVDEIKNAIGAK